ncbi:diguanylate cyclase domain-containing protein [Nocardia sp. NPDC003345]
MPNGDHTDIARSWHAALPGTGDAPPGQRVVAGLVDRVLGDLSAIPFDPAAGFGLGAALAESGFVHPEVPSASAPVLLDLAARHNGPPVAQVAAYIAAMGQGHGAAGAAFRDAVPGPARVDGARAARLQILFDHSAAAIAIGDTEGHILEANQSLADMIGVPAEALRGISVYDFAHPDDHANIRTLLYEKLIPTGQGTVSLKQRLVRADGTIGWMNLGITFAKGTAGEPDYLIAIGADVTDQYQHQLELHHQARHDPLTGLPNRRQLMEALNRCCSTADEGELVGLCFVDLDHFKTINDRLGHHAGDKVLTAVAARLRAVDPAQADHLVARLGGDEFVVLVTPPTTTARVTELSHRLAAVFREPVTVDGHSLQITASIGAITNRIARTGAESLLAAADAGLYFAKNNRSASGTTLHAGTGDYEPGGPDRIPPGDGLPGPAPRGIPLPDPAAPYIDVSDERARLQRSFFATETAHARARAAGGRRTDTGRDAGVR